MSNDNTQISSTIALSNAVELSSFIPHTTKSYLANEKLAKLIDDKYAKLIEAPIPKPAPTESRVFAFYDGYIRPYYGAIIFFILVALFLLYKYVTKDMQENDDIPYYEPVIL